MIVVNQSESRRQGVQSNHALQRLANKASVQITDVYGAFKDHHQAGNARDSA